MLDRKQLHDFTLENVYPIIENLNPDAQVYILDKLEKYRSYSRMPDIIKEIIETLLYSDSDIGGNQVD